MGHGPARQARWGKSTRGLARVGKVWNGRHGAEPDGLAGRGGARFGMVWQAWSGRMSERTDGIGAELLKLKNQDGIINPAEVVKWAKRNKSSRLHSQLEWDDEVAGERYRIWQVRALISVHIVDAEGGRRFVSLSTDRRHDGSNGYRSLEDIVARPDLREIMLKDALSELERIQERYKKLSELAPVWEQADQVRQQRSRRKAAA